MLKKIACVLVAISIYAMGMTGLNAGEKVNLSFSSSSVPNDAHTKAMYVFKDEVEKISNGEITVDVYDSGQLFTQDGEQAAIIRGTVDMIYSSAPWVAQQVPYVSMLGGVYTFAGYDHMNKVMTGEIGKKIYTDIAKKANIRPLTAFYLGTRQLLLRDIGKEVRTPQDMKGVKLRVPNSPTWIALGKALGANPTPMSFSEVYLALKTGVADGQDNPMPTDKNAKFYEVSKYLTLTNHVVDMVWPTMNEKRWQSLTDQQKQWIITALEKARQFCDKTNLDAEAGLVEFFKNNGIVVIEDPDIEAFMKYAKNSYQTESKNISKDWDWKLYEEIQKAKP